MGTKIPITDEAAAVGTLPVDPSFALVSNIIRSAYTMATDAGYVITKNKHSRAITTYQLSWGNITKTDVDLLRAFYITTQGRFKPFLWENVRYHFASALQIEKSTKGTYSVSASIKELPLTCSPSHPVAT